MSADRPPVSADRDPVAVDAADVLAALQDEMFCECGVTHIVTMKPEAVLAALDEAGFDVLPRGQVHAKGQVWEVEPLGRGAKGYPLKANLHEVTAGEGSTDGE